MNISQIIADKRDGIELDAEQIKFLVQGYADHSVPDYQMSAFAMAVFFQGMTDDETEVFTRCMIESGDTLTWSGLPAVDKHSTGGIGDKISIPLAPMLACCGVQVPMISGRGLGATGGTLDKLESIPGYRCELSNDEFRAIVNWNGCSIASASSTLAPADKRLYGLRDVTATVPSVPLITGSILSKKIAEGIEALVLDVKWGSGAFMQTLEQARELANSLVRVGNRLGVKTTAVITDMNQPLGRMIGNSVEIDESVEVLKGEGPADVLELTLELGSRLLVSAGVHSDQAAAASDLSSKIESGEALAKLAEMVKSHGGELEAQRPKAKKHTISSTENGFVSRVNAQRLGLAIIEMGGGRKQIGDELDHSSGIEFLVRLGDPIEAGQPIAHLFCDHDEAYAKSLIGAAVGIGSEAVTPPKLIVETF
jgi:pyrimidine-nucleoside phosphorylase